MSYQEGTNLHPTIASTRDESVATADIIDTLARLGNYSKLIAAIKAAGLEGRLRGPDLVTLFAPDDAVLSRAVGSEDPSESEEKDRLASLLNRHLVRGNIREADLKAHDSVMPIEGEGLRISREGPDVRVGGARIVKANIPCTNGMIHLIDGTLA